MLRLGIPETQWHDGISIRSKALPQAGYDLTEATDRRRDRMVEAVLTDGKRVTLGLSSKTVRRRVVNIDRIIRIEETS